MYMGLRLEVFYGIIKHMKKSDEEVFLELVSKYCFSGKETIKDVYTAMVKALGTTLRKEGHFLLPDIIRFRVVNYKPKKMFNVHAGGIIQMPETKRVKVVLDYKLKKFIKF